MNHDLTVIILTYNEEQHIERCITRVSEIAKKIIVVDSHSEDRTRTIAEECGAECVEHEWPGNQAEQFNWALEHIAIETEWVLRLDADEYLTPELKDEISERLPEIEPEVNGIIFKRRHYFLGKWVKRGTYPVKIMRLFRYGKAAYEPRWMDEHLHLLEGRAIEFEHDFVDHNLHPLGWWVDKHNHYSIREAVEYFDWKVGILGDSNKRAPFTRQKESYYTKPLLFRPFIYFIYRYVLKMGFLEGKEGFLWHFLQGWWYRTLVDAKIFEIKRSCGDDPECIKKYIETQYDLDL